MLGYSLLSDWLQYCHLFDTAVGQLPSLLCFPTHLVDIPFFVLRLEQQAWKGQ